MSFENLCINTVTIEPWTGQNGFGAPTFGSPVTYKARIESGPQMLLDSSGQEIVSSVRVYVNATSGIDPQDRLTLPAPFNPVNPQILKVDLPQDSAAVHHIVIYCGKATSG